MCEFYSCKLCKAVSGRINLYHTILVMHYNYTSSSHVYIRQYSTHIHSKLETLLCNQCSSPPSIVVLVMAYMYALLSTASMPTTKETRWGKYCDAVRQLQLFYMRYNKQYSWESVRLTQCLLLNRAMPLENRFPSMDAQLHWRSYCISCAHTIVHL